MFLLRYLGSKSSCSFKEEEEEEEFEWEDEFEDKEEEEEDDDELVESIGVLAGIGVHPS